MKRVLQTEQQANLETVRRNVDVTRVGTLLVSPGKDKESPLAPALAAALTARGAPAPRVVSGWVALSWGGDWQLVYLESLHPKIETTTANRLADR